MLDAELRDRLVERFTDAVMHTAELPAARRGDVANAPRFTATSDEIACTCAIAGSTHTKAWDGQPAAAEAFASEVGEKTARLLKHTRQYAWLRAHR
jgi:hypothetical protein